MRSQKPGVAPAARSASVPNTCGWRRIILAVMASTTSAKAKAPPLLGHARVIDDLQQEVAQLVLQGGQIVLLDGVRDLVGLLDGVGRDGREGLLEVPGAAGAGRAQGGHHAQQSVDNALVS